MSGKAQLEKALDAWVEQHGMIWFDGDLDFARAIADYLQIDLTVDGIGVSERHRNGHYKHAHPRFGFEYGAARITRMAHIEGRYHVLAIDTPDHHIQVGISPTGRAVRIWYDGEELPRERRPSRDLPDSDAAGCLPVTQEGE